MTSEERKKMIEEIIKSQLGYSAFMSSIVENDEPILFIKQEKAENHILDVRRAFGNDFIIKIEGIIEILSFRNDFKEGKNGALPIQNDYDFSNCIFQCEVKIEGEFDTCLDFTDSKFNNKLNLSSCIFNKKVDFIRTKFDDVIFEDTLFNGNVRFYQAEFNYTNFTNTKFKNLADFWNATFKQRTIFNKTDFQGTTVFASTNFKENVLFTYTLIEKLIIFRGTIFKKGVDLSLAIIVGNINIFDIELKEKEFDVVDDTNDANSLDKYVCENGDITRKNKRETFRILKSRLFSNHNSIDALFFSSLEMKAYNEELKQKLFKKKNKKKYKIWNTIKKIWENIIENEKRSIIQNYLLLKLNLISSNHGTSWLRGFIFTIITTLIFYGFFLLTIYSYIQYDSSCEGWGNFIKYFLQFLNIAYWNYEPFGIKDYTWGYLVLFTGRIFIAYGYYQTIQAFRKFKNK